MGLKRVFLFGILLFAATYLGMARARTPWMIGLLFFAYGVYAAATEGIAKAWISNVVPASQTATAIGTYAGLQSLCALGASSLAGLLWFSFGPMATFAATGSVALAVCLYIGLCVADPAGRD